MVEVIADGVVKVVLGAVFAIGVAPLGQSFGVPAWLMVVSGLARLIGGGIEIRYVRSRPMRLSTRLLVAHDSGWLPATLAGLLMAWRDSTAGGEVWIAYQTAAPLTLAALLAAAAPVDRTSATRPTNSAA